MRIGRFAMHLVLGCAASYAAAQTPTAQVLLSGACADLMHTVVTLLNSGRFLDAEVALAGPTTDGHRGVEPLCTGLALHNVASALAISGRLGEAEVFAQRALHVLEKFYPPDDPALLRTLQVLIAARFGQGETAKAREAFQRMQSIRSEDPEDRAAVHYLGAAFLQKSGEWRQAEVEYLKALAAFRERGLNATADEGAVLCGLGSLYANERRYEEAERILAHALSTFNAAKGTVPMDIVKLLELRGVIYMGMRKWGQAEADLWTALSMIDRESFNDPVILKRLLIRYASALRKTHQGREAHSIEARAASIRAIETADFVADVTDLRRTGKGR